MSDQPENIQTGSHAPDPLIGPLACIYTANTDGAASLTRSDTAGPSPTELSPLGAAVQYVVRKSKQSSSESGTCGTDAAALTGSLVELLTGPKTLSSRAPSFGFCLAPLGTLRLDASQLAGPSCEALRAWVRGKSGSTTGVTLSEAECTVYIIGEGGAEEIVDEEAGTFELKDATALADAILASKDTDGKSAADPPGYKPQDGLWDELREWKLGSHAVKYCGETGFEASGSMTFKASMSGSVKVSREHSREQGAEGGGPESHGAE
jgi:hypothetical protein